jgi:hypothetical protein
MYKITLYVFIFLAPTYAASQEFQSINNATDGYSIDVPSIWSEKIIHDAIGTPTRFFLDASNKKGRGYCQIQLINVPKGRLGKASEKEIDKFLSTKWEIDDWTQTFPNLLSSPGFRSINSYSLTTASGKPSAMHDFIFNNPSVGIYYRTRASLLMSKEKFFSLWCIRIGKNETDAVNNFSLLLPIFQRVQYSFRLKN